MQLQQSFEAVTRGRAVMGEDGTLRVTLEGVAPYRTTKAVDTAEDGTPSEREIPLTCSTQVVLDPANPAHAPVLAQVQAAMAAALALAPTVLAQPMALAIHQARVTASARGEQQ